MKMVICLVKKIAVTGGKGGTGKSMVATALAYALSKKYKNKVLLVDLDVECPNDHILLSAKMEKIKNIETFIPKFDFDKCIKCGKCSKVCKEHAIVSVKNRYPILVEEQCIGCGACKIVCPTGAISEGKQKIGQINKGVGYNIPLINGELKAGFEEAGPVVNAVKKYVSEFKKEKNEKEKSKETSNEFDFIIFDTAPGAHCNVISALRGVDLALPVTEPTPFGAHDLAIILDLLKILNVFSKVVLNRSDIGEKELIENIAKKYNTNIVSEIKNKTKIFESYSKGKPVEDEGIDKIVEFIEKLED